jgi:nicotinamidase-related amidase
MDLLRCENTVLAVVDMQERLLNALQEGDRAAVVRNVAIAVEAAGVLGIPTLVTEQYPKGLGPTAVEIRARMGADFAPIEKLVFSCGRSPEFRAALDATGRRDVLICGIEAHVCVLQTVMDLTSGGYRVYVPADAVRSRRDLDWERGLALMDKAGATVGTTELFLFQLLERAGTDAFRRISTLVK